MGQLACVTEHTALPLRETEARELIARGLAGDVTAFDDLVRLNSGLVQRVLLVTGLHRSPFREDLEQEARLALVAAARRWDPLRGVRFSTFAFSWIRGAVRRAARTAQHGKAVHGSLRDAGIVRWAEEELTRVGINVPTATQLAALLDWDVKRVDEANRCVQPLERLNDRHLDTVGDCESVTPLEAAEVAWERAEVRRMLESLPERDREVITLRFGIGQDAPVSQEDVARKLRVSVERVRNIESRALEALIRTNRQSGNLRTG